MPLDWPKFPNTFDEFLDVVLSSYPRPTPWVDASEDNLRPVVRRMRRAYDRLAADCRKNQQVSLRNDLADLVTDVLRVEIRAQPGHHFDAASKLANRAGLGWIDREQAEKQFNRTLDADSDGYLGIVLKENLTLLLKVGTALLEVEAV
jgi:hypothetical protein